MQRQTAIGLAALLMFAGAHGGALAQEPAAPCAKADFETVVDTAAAALRDLNAKHKPSFQEKLRQLKDKRGWSHEQFLESAAPFVRDDQIAIYDQQSEELLNAISSMGQEGSTSAKPDCGMLNDLRARMKVLVETQSRKWGYMAGKLDAELAK